MARSGLINEKLKVKNEKYSKQNFYKLLAISF